MQLRSKLFYSYLIFLIIYIGFVLLPAPQPATLMQYHVSVLGFRIIDITIIMLLACIWFVGFYGYAKLQAYSRLIHTEKDGKQVARLAQGIFLLVLWLPVSSDTSTVLNYFAVRHLGLLSAATIIENYINLLFPLAGFIFISMGARGLSELVRQRPSYKATNLLVVLLVYIGVVYYHLSASTYHRDDVYHMSIWLISMTLVAPYIFMWFIGLLAMYEIYSYRLKVKGSVYRKGWATLALGLGWLIVTSIGFQYLTTLAAHLKKLDIYWLLFIVYSLLLVLTVGFVLIALGARKLKKIEEV